VAQGRAAKAVPSHFFTVLDRNVYTGQNPASATHLARQLVADLKNNPTR